MSRPELLHEMFGGVHSKLLYMLMHTDGRGEYIFPTGRISLCASLSYTSDTQLIGSHCLYPYSPQHYKLYTAFDFHSNFEHLVSIASTDVEPPVHR